MRGAEPAELLRVALFLASVLGVYAAAFVVLLRRRRRPFTRRGKAVLAVAAAGLACIGWGFLVEPDWLEVTHVEIAAPGISGPIRIAHFSDLHCDAAPRLERRLVEAVRNAHPDLVVFTGDAANEVAGIPVFQECLAACARIAPTFAVRGNWDVGGGGLGWRDLLEVEARRKLFSGTGAHELDGEAVAVLTSGGTVWLAGISVFDRARVRPTLAKVPPGATTIFLCHWPDEIEAVAREGPLLYLCGHTHGGQVALPFYGALVTFSRYGKRFESGLHRVGATWIYVNRGIGMDGKGAPRVRFCARPELTVIELVPG